MKGNAKKRVCILLAASMMFVAQGVMMGFRAEAKTGAQPIHEIKVEERGLLSWFAINCYDSKLHLNVKDTPQEEIAIDSAYIGFEGGRAALTIADRKLSFALNPNTKQGPPEALTIAAIEFVGQEVFLLSRYGAREKLPQGYIQVLPSQKLLWVREPKSGEALWEKWYTLDTTFSRQHTYPLSSLDDRETAYAVARVQAKELLLNELAGLVKTEMDRHPSLLTALLDLDRVKALLPIIVLMRTDAGQWQDRELSLGVVALASPEVDAKFMSRLLKKQRLVADMERSQELMVRAIADVKRLQTAAESANAATETASQYGKAIGRLRALDWCSMARHQAYVGQTEQAVMVYTKAIEAYPELAVAYKNRGLLYTALKDEGNATADRISAVQAYGANALSHMKSKEYVECLGCAEAALELSPDYASGYYLRAACNIGLNQPGTVKEDMVKAAQLGDKGAQDLLSAKGIQWQNGEPDTPF